MNNNNFSIESGYSDRVQVPHINNDLGCNIDIQFSIDTISGDIPIPKKDTTKKYNYKKTCKEVLADAEAFVFNNFNEFEGKTLLNPAHTNFEKRAIAYLVEQKSKGRPLSKADEELCNSTPEIQTRKYLLRLNDTPENYKYALAIEKEIEALDVIIINYNNYVFTLDNSKSLGEQVAKLRKLTDIVEDKLEPKGFIGRWKDDNQVYHKNKKYILFSVRNLGFDITEDEYKSNPSILDNEFIVQCAKYLGFDVRFMFYECPEEDNK